MHCPDILIVPTGVFSTNVFPLNRHTETMDENNIFHVFVTNVLGVATPRFFNKIFGFANNSSALLAVMDT